jgi:hypothetical protein
MITIPKPTKVLHRTLAFLRKLLKIEARPTVLQRQLLIWLISLAVLVSGTVGCGNRTSAPSPDTGANFTSFYNTLEKFLETQQWKNADQQTVNILLAIASKSNYKCDSIDSGAQGIDCIKLYPCEDLQKIDQLWLKHSNGRYGFSVLAKIWREVGSPSVHGSSYPVESERWETFAKRAGWYKGKWLRYDDLNPSIASSDVIFPFLPFEAGTWKNGAIVPQPQLFHYRLASCGF